MPFDPALVNATNKAVGSAVSAKTVAVSVVLCIHTIFRLASLGVRHGWRCWVHAIQAKQQNANKKMLYLCFLIIQRVQYFVNLRYYVVQLFTHMLFLVVVLHGAAQVHAHHALL